MLFRSLKQEFLLTINIILRLSDSFREMVSHELEGRKMVRDVLHVTERLEEHDHPEEQYQCSYCKAFCYLSQVTCPCSRVRVVCLEHVKYLCDCQMSLRILRLRFSDSELSQQQSTIESRAAIPTNWRNKLTKLLNESAKPALRHLQIGRAHV